MPLFVIRKSGGGAADPTINDSTDRKKWRVLTGESAEAIAPVGGFLAQRVGTHDLYAVHRNGDAYQLPAGKAVMAFQPSKAQRAKVARVLRGCMAMGIRAGEAVGMPQEMIENIGRD